jgi:hypothetical protein
MKSRNEIMTIKNKTGSSSSSSSSEDNNIPCGNGHINVPSNIVTTSGSRQNTYVIRTGKSRHFYCNTHGIT